MTVDRVGFSIRGLLRAAVGVTTTIAAALTTGCGPNHGPSSLTGDWDYYRMLGGEPRGGFEARRRFGFAHFEGINAAGAWLHRRAGGDLEIIDEVMLEEDSLFLNYASGASVRAVFTGDTITGRIYRNGEPIQRI